MTEYMSTNDLYKETRAAQGVPRIVNVKDFRQIQLMKVEQPTPYNTHTIHFMVLVSQLLIGKAFHLEINFKHINKEKKMECLNSKNLRFTNNKYPRLTEIKLEIT